MRATIKSLEALILFTFFLFFKRQRLSIDVSDENCRGARVSQFNFYFTR